MTTPRKLQVRPRCLYKWRAISPEQRDDVIAHIAAGLLGAYGYFRAQREADVSVHTTERRCNASPRLYGTIRAPMVLGRSTRSAAAGDGEPNLQPENTQLLSTRPER
jgi:hypothetical protein